MSFLRIDSSRLRFEQAVAAIEERLGGEIRMRDLAEALGTDPDSLSRLFRVAIGRSPSQYLAERRVARAQRWLAHGGRTLDDVATQCGFKSRGEFSHKFAQLVGMSPEAYRHAHLRRNRGPHESPAP